MAPNPGAWLVDTASNKAIGRIRRESKRDDRQTEARLVQHDHESEAAELLGVIDDDRLRLIFTCCHPAFAMETRVALAGNTAETAYLIRRRDQLV